MVVVIVLVDSAGKHWALALQFQSVPRDQPQGLGSNHGIIRAFPSQGEELQQVCLAETWSPETNGWWPPNRWLDLRFDAWLELQKPVWRHSRPSALRDACLSHLALRCCKLLPQMTQERALCLYDGLPAPVLQDSGRFFSCPSCTSCWEKAQSPSHGVRSCYLMVAEEFGET